MKRFVSTSLTVVATALMVTLSFGCGEGVEGETGSQSAELNNGQCNRIVAGSLGLSQQCNQFGCSLDECIGQENIRAKLGIAIFVFCAIRNDDFLFAFIYG